MCVGDSPNDCEVETIIGKHFDANNKVKWKGYGLCEATWVPLNNIHCPNVVCVCETHRRDEQQAQQPNNQSKMMATLDGTKNGTLTTC